MSVQLKSRLITAEEFETYDPDLRLDLIEGVLVPMLPMPGAKHGSVTFKLSHHIGVYVEDNNLGECFAAETRFTIERDPDFSIGPDLAFVAKERLPDPLPDGFLVLAPDLVLEVRSPSDSEPEAVAKMKRWIRAGVRLGWELNLKQQLLTVYRPSEAARTVDINGLIDGEDVLPGFTFPMRRLFPE